MARVYGVASDITKTQKSHKLRDLLALMIFLSSLLQSFMIFWYKYSDNILQKHPFGPGSTTLHFDWLSFSVMVSIYFKEKFLDSDKDYTYLWE